MNNPNSIDTVACNLWSFASGQWEPISIDDGDPFKPYEVQDPRGWSDWEKTKSAAGYSYADYTPEDAPSFRVSYAANDTDVTKRWAFLVEFDVCMSRGWTILVATLPDLFALAPAVGAFAARDHAAEYASEVARATRERRERRR